MVLRAEGWCADSAAGSLLRDGGCAASDSEDDANESSGSEGILHIESLAWRVRGKEAEVFAD
jgi:hypothetical protein